MAELGKLNQLRVARESPHGAYLDGENLGEILLPRRYCQKDTVPGAALEVFLYRDSEDRLVATTETPFVMAGEFGSLRVRSVHPQLGAFLDWGLSRDLLLPRREQARRVQVGDHVVVYVHVEAKSQHLIATTHLQEYLSTGPADYEEKQRVRLLVAEETPLGYRVIVEGRHWGMLFKSDLGAPLAVGRETPGFVRRVRPDGKIDLALDQSGHTRITPLALRVLEQLRAAGGRLHYHDSTSPAEIRNAFGVSKRAFKQAVGALYRARRIRLTEDGIELMTESKSDQD
ncbi:MAG: S1-like domain-containing RNA-binding protein [Chthoniobacteraceae bacterium]